jgi:hypothetical protein
VPVLRMAQEGRNPDKERIKSMTEDAVMDRLRQAVADATKYKYEKLDAYRESGYVHGSWQYTDYQCASAVEIHIKGILQQFEYGYMFDRVYTKMHEELSK